MFAIGPLEIAVVLIFALLFIGPKKLPELARQAGKFFVQMKRVTSDVRSTVDDYMKKAEDEILSEERAKVRATLEKALNSDDLNIQKQISDALAVNPTEDTYDLDTSDTQEGYSAPHQPAAHEGGEEAQTDESKKAKWETDPE